MNWIKEIMGIKMRQLEAQKLSDFELIHERDVNLVYQKRKTDEEIINYAKLLFEHGFNGINQIVSPDTMENVVIDSLDEFGFQTVGKVRLKEDIMVIGQTFFTVTRAANLRLILKVITNNACSKFHTDAYDLRLLCTYAGNGTEWISEDYVNRKKLLHGTNEEIIRDFKQVKCFQPFDVAILKGEVNARPNVKGIVHRSPAIEHTGEKRLLLRFDF
jgi:hypothetical protein